MDCTPFVPNMICSSCGTIIANKFLQFNMLVECGSSRQEAFEALDITRYCCRQDLSNPIVLTKTVIKEPVKIEKTVVKIVESTDKYRIPKKKPGINRLTSSKGNEIAVVSLTYSTNDSNLLDDLKDKLSLALESKTVEDIPFVKKEVDIGEVFGDNFLSCFTEEQVGSGMLTDRIHRVYEAT